MRVIIRKMDDHEFYYNNGMPFSTGDKASNENGDYCAIDRSIMGKWIKIYLIYR